ncbi:sensor histidine kinase, partial [Streptosporangium algeriense]
AESARAAMRELHELVGALRGEEERSGSLTVEAIGTVTEEFRRAGVPVTLRERGRPRPLSFAAGQAAYRVVEEGLTNAAKHAPRQPVTVSVEWESDALLLTVANPLPAPVAGAGGRTQAGAVGEGQAGAGRGGLSGLGVAGPEAGTGIGIGTGIGRDGVAGSGVGGGGGHGLAGLAERVRPAGGVLDHRLSGDGFRLFAMLPLDSPADQVSGPEPDHTTGFHGLSVGASSEPETDHVTDDLPAVGRLRTVALGAAVAVLMFVTLPASLLLGVVR